MSKFGYRAGISFLALVIWIGIGTPFEREASAAVATVPNVVNVVATDYRFDMLDTLPAGPTLFHLVNNGAQLHHMTIVRLQAAKTLADFTALPPDAPPPAWAVFVGGPNAASPKGGQSEAALDLAPGHYAVICVIPGPDGKPHMMDGMIKALTVVPSAVRRAMPAAHMTLTLTDYAFTFSRPVSAGRRIIRVINHGTQPHEAVFVRLGPGKTGEDVARWVDNGMHGTPPGMPFAGISALAPGDENTAFVNLTAGDYALLCFAPDVKDGKRHTAHGMIHDFKVM